MCIAVPMKLLEMNGNSGKVMFSGNEIKVNLCLISPQVGDYVLVHAGCAIEIVQQDTAEELLGIFELIEEAAHED